MAQAFAITALHVCRKPGRRVDKDHTVSAEIEIVPAGTITTLTDDDFKAFEVAGAVRKPTRMDRALASVEDDPDQVEAVTGKPNGGAPQPLPSADELEAMTRAELEALAVTRGVDVSKAKNKGDVVDALIATAA